MVSVNKWSLDNLFSTAYILWKQIITAPQYYSKNFGHKMSSSNYEFDPLIFTLENDGQSYAKYFAIFYEGRRDSNKVLRHAHRLEDSNMM